MSCPLLMEFLDPRTPQIFSILKGCSRYSRPLPPAMKTESQFLHDHQLIIQVVRENITIDGMIAARQHEIDMGWVRKGCNSLIVLQTETTDITPADLRTYTEWSKEHLPELSGSKTAIVANSPRPTALSLLLQTTIAGIRQMQVFSSLTSAAGWLGVPVAEITKAVPETREFETP